MNATTPAKPEENKKEAEENSKLKMKAKGEKAKEDAKAEKEVEAQAKADEEAAEKEAVEKEEADKKESSRLKSEKKEAEKAVKEEVEADPLRQYQFRKETELGSKDSDPQPGSKAEKMKNTLLAQRRVKILIPPDAGMDPKIPLSVNLNGYRLDLPRNAYVELPEQLADVIVDSSNQTNIAIERGRVDKDNEALA